MHNLKDGLITLALFGERERERDLPHGLFPLLVQSAASETMRSFLVSIPVTRYVISHREQLIYLSNVPRHQQKHHAAFGKGRSLFAVQCDFASLSRTARVKMKENQTPNLGNHCQVRFTN